MKEQAKLSRREREIMDLLYRHRQLTASEIVELLPDSPSNSAVRTILRILEDKGHARHQRQGTRYLYSPTVAQEKARRSALDHVVSTFFDGNPEAVVSALLDTRSLNLTRAQLDSLAKMIERARREGR